MLDLGNRIKSGKRTDDADDLFAGEAQEDFDNDSASGEEDFEEVPVTTLRRAPSRKRSRRAADDEELDKLESARMLEEARCRMGMTPADVEEITKIRAMYIQSLEAGRFEELPQAVYTLAYLRRLCELYNLSKEDEEQIVAPWSDIQCERPESYTGTCFADESGENRRIIRRFEIAIFSIIAIVVIALGVFGAILLVSYLRGNDGRDQVSFDENVIVELQPEAKLQLDNPLPGGRR
ncbi:MAG: helix-turn-helix domain-containing protein [Lentisphaeria bacterium]|nr:helix-turn-helix domain-containing protein [Lentisphaeria bacterium]